MPHTHRMSSHACRELVLSYREEYVRESRRGKGAILERLESDTGYHRKYLCRLLCGKYRHHPRPRRRGRHYTAVLDDALRVIFESHDGICAERIHPNLLAMAEHLAYHGELVMSLDLREQLSRVSLSTVRRHWTRIKQDEPRLLRRKPRPRNGLRERVPMRRIPWQESEPGHFEVDLVHHSGPSAQGEFVCTLQMVDVATGWSELRAVLGRSYRVMQHAFEAILVRLPFEVLELHPDNGSEFFNDHLMRFWAGQVPGLRWSRSRPYIKNDNRFVEQRNGDLVRGYLGDDRLDSVSQTGALNALYDMIWLYFNLFQPVRRQVAKEYLSGDGPPRIRRTFDAARTPWHRLCATGRLDPSTAARLEQLRHQTNPRALRVQIYAQIDRVFTVPGAQPNITEDIFETLTNLPMRKEEAFPVTFTNE
jgi:IS30 family transposase